MAPNGRRHARDGTWSSRQYMRVTHRVARGVRRRGGHSCPLPLEGGQFRGGFHMVTQEAVGRNTRLTTPLMRKDGRLEPASWDEALDLVATRLGEIKARHGGNAV